MNFCIGSLLNRVMCDDVENSLCSAGLIYSDPATSSFAFATTKIR